MRFDFNFGKKKSNIKQYAIIGVILSSIIASLSNCTGISQNDIWDLIDEIQRKYFPQTIINDFIIKDPEKLDRRIKRDISSSIEKYEQWEKENRKINMKNKNILNEIKKEKYTDTQRLIIENALYYEFPPDGSKAQDLLGGTMGIRAVWHSLEGN